MSMSLVDALRFYLIPDFGVSKCLSVLAHLSCEEFFNMPKAQAQQHQNVRLLHITCSR